jgi:hypothetical protein
METDVCSTKALHEKQSSELASSISKMSYLPRKQLEYPHVFETLNTTWIKVPYPILGSFLNLSPLASNVFAPLQNSSNWDYCHHQLVFLPVSFRIQCNISRMFQPQSDPSVVAMKYIQQLVKKSLLFMDVVRSSVFFSPKPTSTASVDTLRPKHLHLDTCSITSSHSTFSLL